ncbi:tetratricopeptide repeat protein [Fuerstiella marisgermanici]|uniref:Putative PEP-CTERM system TPR-repeat lipoprotein n=1 Tax=Fuerstiella marisgermanici TaxID=1891926 RepID=A0A1P8WQH4_9PLAN|nr:tetratricopeptide repeat protein [Fuerstiella marisgermanici]APZ96311.1 putative PEP-CTERM system TPR-repeat lipoprotein [Fuerstiella marisgermanici]
MSDSFDTPSRTKTVSRAMPDYEDTSEQRELPGVVECLRPKYVIGFIVGFLERWVLSRHYNRLLIAMPFLVLAIGGSAFLWWLRSAPRNELVRDYEQAVVAAQREEDVEKSNLYLQALVELRPSDKRYKFASALELMENGREAQGFEYIRELTVEGPLGYNPARVWLAQQALRADSGLPLSEVDPEVELARVIEGEPKNAEANRLLALINLKKGRIKAAEDHLLKAVEDAPFLGLQLVEIQRQLKRSDDQIDYHLKNAADYFQDQLLKDPHDVEANLNRTRAYVLAEETDKAIELLQECPSLNDAPELQQALAMLHLKIAVQLYQKSHVNRDYSTQQLVKAIQLAPGNRQIAQTLLAMASQGAALSAADVAPMVETFSAQDELTVADEELLSQALAVTGQFEQAISRIEPLAEEHPQLQPQLVRLYAANGDTQKAETLTQQLLADFQSRQSELSLVEVVSYGDVLIQASRAEEARDVLKVALTKYTVPKDDTAAATAGVDQPGTDAAVDTAERKNLFQAYRLFTLATIAMFDKQLQADSFAAPQDAIALLHEALSTQLARDAVLERLAKLAFSNGKFAKPADEYLTKLLATGTANAPIYSLLGTLALEQGNLKKARLHLERAYSMHKGNPLVLNNLAIVLIRQSDENADRALALVNDTLQLVPENADALSTRAEVLIAMKRWEEARRDLVVALPKRQQSQNVRKLLAKVCDALDETALANEHRRILTELEAAEASQTN